MLHTLTFDDTMNGLVCAVNYQLNNFVIFLIVAMQSWSYPNFNTVYNLC